MLANLAALIVSTALAMLQPIGQFEVVAYCTEQYPHICGGNAYTYTGTPVQAGLTVAVDPDVIPLGSWLYIEDVGWRQAQDTGGAIQGRRIDMAVEMHGEALEWGMQERGVTIFAHSLT